LARRNLGDVLHYFISEEEQAELKSAARTREHPVATAPGRAPRYLLPADPQRPLACALALELASGLAGEAGDARVLSSFAPSPLLPRVAGVRWQTCDDPAAGIEAAPEFAALIAVERPARLAALLVRIAAHRLDGIVLPVEAAPWGLGKALGLLRELAPALSNRRVLGLVVGAPPGHEAAAQLVARLSGAAQRQHGVSVELVGELARDADSYRSLLCGESLHSLGAESASAESLRALCERLKLRLAA
jgi:hypothetical protein